MDRTEVQINRRIRELANMADQKGIVTYTDFLNLNELNIFYETVRKISHVSWELFGGYTKAERQLAAFIPDALYLYEEDSPQIPDFPLRCLKISPSNPKFAETLTHRDYLGALLNLGIERSVLGDILVDGCDAYVFCLKKIADYLCRELTRVRRTTVNCSIFSDEVGEIPLHTQQIQGSVASVRLDSLLALAWKESRSSIVRLIGEGKVFVNGRCITTNAYTVKEQDLISARGIGRFQYCGVLSQTKKGRLLIKLEKFI